MTDDIITTDNPLTSLQQSKLSALADTLLPASADGLMPSASELDLPGHLHQRTEDFMPRLLEVIDSFDDQFIDLPMAERCTAVTALSAAQPELFEWLLFEVYDCYYQNSQVFTGIGLEQGSPFPRGNTVEDGDLSLLDAVVERSKTYRV